MLPLARQEVLGLLKRDPWLVIKYTVMVLILSLIGKSIMIGAVDGADVPKIYGQFAPSLPMLLVNFTVYKYLWGQPQLKLRSHLGKKWSKAYGTEFVIGHGLFTLFAVELGMNYIAVSTVVGVLACVASYFINDRLFGNNAQKTATAAPPLLAQ